MNSALAIFSIAASLCGCLSTPARPIGDGSVSDTLGDDAAPMVRISPSSVPSLASSDPYGAFISTNL